MKWKLSIADRDLIGAIPPRWYGFAYRKHEVRYTIFYIIPLNLIVRYARQGYWLIWHWLKVDGWKSKLDDAYWRGFNDGTVRKDADFDRLARIIRGLK